MIIFGQFELYRPYENEKQNKKSVFFAPFFFKCDKKKSQTLLFLHALRTRMDFGGLP